MTRVLIADDHPVVREGLRAVLASNAGIDVIGEASNGGEAMSMIASLQPDVVVLDVNMPDRSGIDVTKQLRDEESPTAVVIASIYDDREVILAAVEAGARAYVVKDCSPQDLLAAIFAAARGDTYFAGKVAEVIANAGNENSTRTHNPLSKRETEVLALVASGMTNREMADHLGISHRTIESHRENLMRKLEIRSIAGLTRYAIENHIEIPQR